MHATYVIIIHHTFHILSYAENENAMKNIFPLIDKSKHVIYNR